MTTTFTPDLIGWYFVVGGSQITYARKGIWPSTYLAYAQADFEGEKDARTLVNTISNAKRALHYQVEGLAEALGWNHFKSRDDFPTRLNFLGLCGVLSPTIIRRINRIRNSVEYDYYIPSCRVPDDCIEPRRYPLLAAREAMRQLVDDLLGRSILAPGALS